MDTWERFSRALEESKKVEEECGCEESDTKSKKKIVDLRGMRTDINNAKNKLRAMGLKMSQELEGEQLDEFLGTGRVVAGRSQAGSNPAGGSKFTQAGTVQKVFGVEVPGSFQQGVSASDVQRHNQKSSSNTQIKPNKVSTDQLLGKKPGGQYTGGITPDKKPAAPTAKPVVPAAKPQTASAAMSQVFKGTPLSGVANIANRYDRQINYRDQSPETRRMLGLKNSYEPEGELVDEGKKDLPQTKMYRKAGNLARQALSSKGAKKEKAMDRSAKIVSAITRETERKRFDEIGKSPAHNSNYKEEYIEEKSLSRAQQRFFGMVRAAQDGKMKSPSPEVAKAAKEMTTKQAHDFAATKHKGLPEKKEVKEEISLVEKMIAQYSPISEGKLDDLLNDIRGSGEDPNQSQKKRVLKKKSTQDNSEASGGIEKKGKGAKTSRERQAVISGTTRVKAKSVEAKGKIEVEREKAKAKLEAEKERTNREKLKGERQKLAIEVDREKRTEKKTEKEKTAAEKSAERQKSLEQKDKQKRIEAGNKAVGDYEKEQAKKNQRSDELKSAFVRPSGGSTATEKDSDLTVLSAAGSNIGSGIKALGKTALNLGKIAMKRRGEKKDEIKKQEIRKKAESKPTQSETFSNWREEFIIEIDDVSVDNDASEKIIDVSKKKNKIEINPKLDEGVEIEESKK